MGIIEPIDELVQQKVTVEVQRYIAIAAEWYQKEFEPIDVAFDIKGKAAGIYHCAYIKNSLGRDSSNNPFSKKYQRIRFNPWLFKKYPKDNWNNTIPHEVAHYISDCIYDLKKIKPHGREWREIMGVFGADPIVRGSYSLKGIPVRKVRRYRYYCACGDVDLSAIRHNKIQSGKQKYRCRNCQEILVWNNRVVN